MNARYKILFVSLLFGLQSFGQINVPAVEKKINSHLGQGSPGAAIGIVKNGQIIYEGYFGLANLEHQVQVNETTTFNIASNAKQFTALCILKLEEAGKLSLDDPINKFMPDLQIAQENEITIQHLLNHSSGIRDVYDLWALTGQTWWKLFIDNNDALDLLARQEDLNNAPGSEYFYSNSNYILLTKIVEAVTDMKFNEYAQELFGELGMQHTSFLTNYMSVIPNRARPYANWNGWKEYPSIAEIHGDGNLYTTLDDQLRWEIWLQDLKKGADTLPWISKSQTLVDEKIDNYGFGVMYGDYRGISNSYHDGNTGAYNATFMRFPTEGLSIVVMSNNGNFPTNYLAKQLIDEIVDPSKFQDPDYPLSPDRLNPIKDTATLLGNYRTEDGTIIKITERDNSLYREIYQREPVKLLLAEKNLYLYESNADLKIAFETTPEGTQIFTIYYPGQEPNVGTRLPDFEIRPEYWESLNGTYVNKETDTEIEITYRKDQSYSVIKNGREREGQLILKDFLRMNSYEISITRNEKGEVSGLSVNNGRIKHVIFQKI